MSIIDLLKLFVLASSQIFPRRYKRYKCVQIQAQTMLFQLDAQRR